MSRRQRKKAASQRAAQRPPTAVVSVPEAAPRAKDELVFGPDGLVDRLLRFGVSRERVFRGLAAAAVRLCRQSPSPEFATSSLLECLGEALGTDAILGQRLVVLERCELHLRVGFLRTSLPAQLVTHRVETDDRRLVTSARSLGSTVTLEAE